jgi:hypothetical protein
LGYLGQSFLLAHKSGLLSALAWVRVEFRGLGCLRPVLQTAKCRVGLLGLHSRARSFPLLLGRKQPRLLGLGPETDSKTLGGFFCTSGADLQGLEGTLCKAAVTEPVSSGWWDICLGFRDMASGCAWI